MWWRNLLIVLLLAALVVTFLLVNQQYPYKNGLATLAGQDHNIVMSSTYAGGAPPTTNMGTSTHYDPTSYNVSEGKRLYHWYNCSTCHANGGGDIGPPLMDDKWLYGAEPGNIYASIVEGRPNGMPSFRSKIPDQQVWQIVAYIRSLSGHVPSYTRQSREDDIQAKVPDTRRPVEPIHKGSNPSANNKSTTP